MTVFLPTRGLRNPHVQAILAQLPMRRRRVRRAAAALLAQSRPVLLHGGEAQLQGFYSACGENAPLAILLHGWEGSADSLYVLATAALLHRSGWAVLRINLRDHGDSHHLNRELFHSCREEELAAAILDAQARWPAPATVLAGFSLGGNFALRMGTRLPISAAIKKIIAVCPVADPSATMQALEQGWWLYRRYFVHKWRRSLARKAAVHPDLSHTLRWPAHSSLTAMTRHFVDTHTDFPGMQAYLQGYALSSERLQQMRFAAHIIVAADDPMIALHDWQNRLQAAPITLEISRFGGHCGFIKNLAMEGWIEQRLCNLLNTCLPVGAATVAVSETTSLNR